MTIDITYFTNKLALPQLGNADGLAIVDGFMQQYEQVYLRCVLGNALWKAFNTGTEDSGVEIEERFEKLIDGDEYEDPYGNLILWNGFAPSTKISPIANFVYYHMVSDKITDYTNIGIVQSIADNNRIADPTDRLVDTWNRMVDMNRALFGYLKHNKSIYPEWKVCRCRSHYCCDNCYKRCGTCGEDNLFEKKTSLGI